MDYKTEIHKAGRITIPIELRRELGLIEGDSLILRYENGETKLLTRKQLLAEACAIVRNHIPADVSLVDELIAERRAEAAREAAEIEEWLKPTQGVTS
jgi:AbrB family looped-hinge helix DNA binding protein